MIEKLLLTFLATSNIGIKTPIFNHIYNNNITRSNQVIENNNTNKVEIITEVDEDNEITKEVYTSPTGEYDRIEGYISYNSSTKYYNNYAYIQMNSYCMNNITPIHDQEFTLHQIKTIFVMAITPYNALSNGNAKLTYKISFDRLGYDSSTLNYQFYTTKEELMMSYIDVQNWQDTNLLWTNINNQMQLKEKEEVLNNSQPLPNNTIQYTNNLETFSIDINNRENIIVYGIMQTSTSYTDYQITGEGANLYIKKSQINGYKIPIAPIEVIDMPNLIFTILTMPFTFISQAFNLTLFPGTPYQINISNIFLAIIGISFMIWILKLILGKADLGTFIREEKGVVKQERKNHREKKRLEKDPGKQIDA